MGAGRGTTLCLRKTSTAKTTKHTEKKKMTKQTPTESRKRRMADEPQKCNKRRRKSVSSEEEDSADNDVKQLKKHYNKLLCTFGDCDPDYIAFLLVQQDQGRKRYKRVRKELSKNYKTYPKLKEKLKREYVLEQREKLGNGMTLQEYMKRRSLITEDDRSDKTYIKDVMIYLGNTFRFIRPVYIRKIVGTEGLLPEAYNKLKEVEEAVSQDLIMRPAQRFLYTTPHKKIMSYSEEKFSELFYLDKFYIENQEAIDAYGAQPELWESTENVPETESFGISETECPVCLLLEPTHQMVTCGDGEHLFCRFCISQYLKEQQDLAKDSFTCPSTYCNELLPLPILQQFLPESSYRQAQLRTRERELRRSQSEGLEWCPKCPYGVVFPADSKQTILQCENPGCLVATCRRCRDPAHIPYSCKERATACKIMKHFIENEMSEAVIRKCPRCETRFVKDGGCNRVECSGCHLIICYSCGKEKSKCVKSKRCDITDTTTLHRQDIEKMIPLAEKLYKEKHPEAETISLAAHFLNK